MLSRMTNKNNVEKQFEILRTLVAIAIALSIAFIIILLISDNPINALASFVIGPLTTTRRLGNIVEALIPLLFTGTAVSLIFSANQTNLAVEGAFFIGGVGASFMATQLNLPPGIHLVVALIVAGIIGALACGIPAILYIKFDARPVVSSLMVNYVCLYLGLAVINHVIRDPAAGFLASFKFNKTAVLPKIIKGTNVHFGIFLGIIIVILGYLYLYKYKKGYEIRMVGKNVDFAKYSGINVNSVLMSAQLLGGFIAGMGGAVEVLGMYNRFQYQKLTGHGFDGILVGIIAKNNPKLVPLTALFLAYIRVGADVMSRVSDIPIELVSIIQAIIIMFVVAERFLYKLKHKKIVSLSRNEINEKEEIVNG
ncbi:MAG TPA: ABC transporter permease [Clostridiales bacterium]|nr:ABC transporter permease [Clostridiales bacterium]